MTCDRIQQRVSDLLDANTDLPAEIEQHLTSCATCREAFDAMVSIDARLREELPAALDVSPELHRSITAMIEIDTRLREELPDAPEVSAELHNRIIVACRRDRARRFIRRASSVAAVLAIAVLLSVVLQTPDPKPVMPGPGIETASDNSASGVAWVVSQDMSIPSPAQSIQDRVITPAANELAALGRSARGTIETMLAMLPPSGQ